MATRLTRFFLCLGIAGTSLAALGSGNAMAAGCDRVAAPGGSDSNPGTEATPFATAQKLVDSLASGQTGCFRTGTYAADNQISIRQGGITVTSYPGERATLNGRLWIAQGADGVTVSALNLDGRNSSGLPSPSVNAADAHFTGDDVTNEHTDICFSLGHHDWGQAVNTVIEHSRIHDCGKLPSQNMDHGFYVNYSDGAIIRDNYIYDNADRGVQLYPDAQRTTISNNVIDGNGEGVIFSGANGTASSNNVVEHNIITNSNLRNNVESWYPSGNPTGTGNVVRDNCLYGGAQGNVGALVGFVATSNKTADPGFADRQAKDFRISSSSPCSGDGPASVPVTGGSFTTDGGGSGGSTGGSTGGSGTGGSTTGGGATTSIAPPKTIRLGGRRHVRSGTVVALHGTVTGLHHVVLQRRSSGGWQSLSKVRVHAKRFVARVRMHGHGSVTLRAAAPGAHSRALRVRIH